MLNVLVVGIGGIGSLYSLILRRGCKDGLHLSFVARSNYSAIKQDGISIRSAKYGDHLLRPDMVYQSTKEAAQSGKTYDYVFCTTKSLPNSPAIALLKPVVSAETSIVMIQNGLHIEQPIHLAFPANTLISCASYIGVWQKSPGVIEHSAIDRLELGTYPDLDSVAKECQRKDSAALTDLVNVLRAGGTDCKVVPSMPAARWQKLIWNASFNVVCTITGMDTFQVSQCSAAKELVLSAMNEIIDTANRCGYALSKDLVTANWENTKALGVAYKPSMMLDHEARREMEVDVILGAPIAEAERVGTHVPTLKTLRSVLECLNFQNGHKSSSAYREVSASTL